MRKLMQKFGLQFFLLLAGMFFVQNKVLASHIIGGEITYKCLGGDQFQITLDIYRDCNTGNAQFDNPLRFTIYRDNEQMYFDSVNISPILIEEIPADVGDPCLFVPDNVCVEAARYQAVVNLPDYGGGYNIVYQRCCRNITISNIEAPDSTGATYNIYLSDKARDECNTSPEFGTYPPVFICVNKPIEFLHSATDAEGDSLVYSLCTPLAGATINVPQPYIAKPPPYDSVEWKPPFNLDNLLGGDPPLEIDPQTGLLTGLPEVIGQYVIGVCVEEYRNGELLSLTRRDFQYNVGLCGEIISVIEAPPAICYEDGEDLTVTFDNKSNDSQNFLWYFDWPNTSASSTDSLPTHTYMTPGHYTIALIAEPGSQCVDTSFHDIFLQYNSLNTDFEIATYDCSTTSVLSLQDLSTDNVSDPISWNWTVDLGGGNIFSSSDQNPVFIIPNPSSGTITLTVETENTCLQTVQKAFQTGNNNPDDFLPEMYDLCFGEEIDLNPDFNSTTGFTYAWGAPINSNEPNPTVSPTQTTIYAVTITAPDGGCQIETDVTVEVTLLPELDFEYTTQCDAVTVNFVNNSINTPGYVWQFGDMAGSTSTELNPEFVYPAVGTYSVTLSTNPGALCQASLTKEVDVVEKILEADVGFSYTDCGENYVTINFNDASTNSLNNTQSWAWTLSNGSASNSPTFTVSITQEQMLDVDLVITTEEGCVDEITETILIDFIEFPALDSVLVCPGGSIALNPNGDPSYAYQWSPDGTLSDASSPNPIATPNGTTLYDVQITNTVTDVCTINKQVLVFVPPPIGLDPDENITTCDPTAEICTASSETATYSWFDENSTFLGNNACITVDVSGVNNYLVQAVDQYNCQEQDFVVVLGGPVDWTITDDQIVCTNEPLNVGVTNLDPNDDLTVQWIPEDSFEGGTGGELNPQVILTPGEQTLTVIGENQFGCKDTLSTDIAIVDENINLDFDFEVQCNGSTVEFTNLSTDAYNYVWNFGDPGSSNNVSNETNPIHTYSAIGTYLVTLNIVFDLDCVIPITKEVEIVAPEFIPRFSYEFDEPTCSTDSVTIHFYDISTNFLNNTSCWEWDFSTGQSFSGGDELDTVSITVYANTNLTATLTICTPNDCSGSDTQTLEIILPETPSPIGGEIVLCYGDTTRLNPGGNDIFQYQWSPDDGTIDDPNATNPTAFPLTTTPYSVTVTSISADTCAVQGEVLVTIPERVFVTASDDVTTTCGSAITISATSNIDPDVDYVWSFLSGIQVGLGPVLSVNPADEQTYVVEGTDQFGCFNRDTVLVTNEDISFTANFPMEACPNDTIQISASSDILEHDLNFTWTTSAPGQILSNPTEPNIIVVTAPTNGTVTYTVTAENQFNCTADQTVTISSYDFNPMIPANTLACPGIETEINPGADLTCNYTWAPDAVVTPSNAPNPTVTILQTGIFTVTISKPFGMDVCMDVLSTTVEVPEIIEITETVDTITCGEPITVCATANVPINQYVWCDAAGNQIGTGNCFLDANPVDDAFYIIKATDHFDCSAQDTVFVSNEETDVEIDGNGFIATCPRDSFQICIYNLDIDDVLTYQWEVVGPNGEILSGVDEACPWVSTTPNETAFFQVTATNQFGCQETQILEVLTYEFDAAVSSTVRVCSGVPTELNPGFTQGLFYHWEPDDCISDPSAPNPIITTTENKTLTATVMGFNGPDTCMATLTVEVIVNPLINLAATPDEEVLCEHTDITFSANTDPAVETITWSANPDFSNPLQQDVQTTTSDYNTTPTHTETYYILAIDDLGCRDSTSVTVNSYPLDVSLNDAFIFCKEDGTILMEVTNNDLAQNLAYQWYPDGVVVGNNTANPVEIALEGNATVFVDVENQFGCTATDSAFVEFFDLELDLIATAAPDTIIFGSGEFSQLQATFSNDFTYEWSPCGSLDDCNIHDPQAMPESTTTYTVTVSNEEGCFAENDVTVVVINPDCQEPFVFVPTAFSPNNDGENDVLYVRGNNLESVTFAIYNRWGQKVFETNDKNIGWSGTFKNEFLPPGVYGYFLKAKCFNGQDYFKKGNVTLIR